MKINLRIWMKKKRRDESINAKRNEIMRSILNEEQFKKMQEMRRSMPAKDEFFLKILLIKEPFPKWKGFLFKTTKDLLCLSLRLLL
jgi:hypothetical protein